MVDYLTVLDLFSGPGGLSEGIQQARNHNFRFKVIVATDLEPTAASTYMKNHSDVDFILGSITEKSIKQKIISSIQTNTRSRGIDVVIGGPPCKGFSLENKMTRNMENPMNHLVTHYVDMIRKTNPVAFVMENVPGILAMQNREIVNNLLSKFKSLGYHNSIAWLLNAADYGVPQIRKRAFLVGSKSSIPIEKPIKTHGNKKEVKNNSKLLPYVNISDAIHDLPRIPKGRIASTIEHYNHEPKNPFQKMIRKKSKRVTNHVITRNSPLVTKRIKVVPPGGNWKNIPIHLMQVNGKYANLKLAHSMIYRRLLKNNPSITITNFRKAMMIHPSQHRLLSVREAARIQTFPDHFEFEGGLGNQQQQVSDAVPVQLAKKVGDSLLLHLHFVLPLVSVR